jgi:hypothetical protein
MSGSTTVYSSYNNCLIKLKLSDGTLIQGPVDLTPIVTGGIGYIDTIGSSDIIQPSSAIAISNSGSLTYLTVAIVDKYNTIGLAGRAVTIDVTSNTAHMSAPYASYVWATPTFCTSCGLALGQFATATYTDVHGNAITDVFFTGQYFGPWVVGNYTN